MSVAIGADPFASYGAGGPLSIIAQYMSIYHVSMYTQVMLKRRPEALGQRVVPCQAMPVDMDV